MDCDEGYDVEDGAECDSHGAQRDISGERECGETIAWQRALQRSRSRDGAEGYDMRELLAETTRLNQDLMHNGLRPEALRIQWGLDAERVARAQAHSVRRRRLKGGRRRGQALGRDWHVIAGALAP